jgi:hypothetical protein
MMNTAFTLYRADGTDTEGVVSMKQAPTLHEIDAVVRPLISTLLTTHDHSEHVTVFKDDERMDMFVDDAGQAKGLPRNEQATTLYRTNWMNAYPHTDPETLPFIYGDAVLFHRRVWF